MAKNILVTKFKLLNMLINERFDSIFLQFNCQGDVVVANTKSVIEDNIGLDWSSRSLLINKQYMISINFVKFPKRKKIIQL